MLRAHIIIYIFREDDAQFIARSTEQELVQLFKSYDELQEQQQDLENKLDEAEDVVLPYVMCAPSLP